MGPMLITAWHHRLHNLLTRTASTVFFLCDMLRTILTQSPNQQSTGTCSHIVSLGVLSRFAPAKAIEVSVRLMWTGAADAEITPPCEYIFDQQPGLVPFMYNGSVRPVGYHGDVSTLCSGSEQDCAAAEGHPLQDVGLTEMWTQSLISGFQRFNWNGCTAAEMPKAPLHYPGMNNQTLRDIDSVEGGNLFSVRWECNRVIDPVGKSCRAAFNRGICAGLSDEDCANFVALPLAGSLAHYLIDLVGNGSDIELQPLVERYPVLEHVTRILNRSKTTLQKLFPVREASWYPSFTEELLKTACASKVAMFVIDATPLEFPLESVRESGLPFFGTQVPLANGSMIDVPEAGTCNHVVYLESCDANNNNYTIWSWGQTFQLTKEIILGIPITRDVPSRTNETFNTGMVCGAILADAITSMSH